jgi:cytochrome c5
VSKHDDHFFNTFSTVIGILVTITLCILALARHLGAPIDAARAMEDPAERQAVTERIAPFGRAAVSGADNSALAIKATTGGAGPTAAALPKSGAEAYQRTCSACHATGAAGAPKYGNKGDWAARLAQGKATLYQHALTGFKAMPAKGGGADLSDDLVRQAVDYMAKAAQ